MSNEDWGMWAEEKPEPVVIAVEPSEPFGYGLGQKALVGSFLDLAKVFAQSSGRLSTASGGIRLDMEAGVNEKLLEKLMVRIVKPREPSVKFSGFFITDELSSFEEPKPNWTQTRGLKGSSGPKKTNNPKGNKLYGTTWRKKNDRPK